jgi:D-alanine-D-alanine ligase
MEVSVGVIDYKGETIVLGITEIVPTNEFFDYEAKYEGASEEITLQELMMKPEKVEEIAKRAYNSLGMSGFSRSEYILMDGIPYMLEMNTNRDSLLQVFFLNRQKLRNFHYGPLWK